MQKGALPGFRDFYPEDLALRAHIFETWRRVATRYGFEEYDGPPLESLELYTAKSGDEIVHQLYEFMDKGKRRVALRPEMTPTLARMVAARANGLKKPIRWFSIPQLFRYEKKQKGRFREHYQLNCDLLGEAGPLADAEIIALAVDVMSELGLGPSDVRVRLSDRDLLEHLFRSVGVLASQLTGVYGAIDKLERAGSPETNQRLLDLGLEPSIVADVLRVVQLNSIISIEQELDSSNHQAEFLSRGRMAAGPLKTTIAALDAMGLGAFVQVDLRIVRGLDYYTGTVFEIFDVGGTHRAICGGGRYDKLTLDVGGVQLPAVGFGMGDVVLGDLLKEKGKAPSYAGSIDVFVATEGAEGMAAALKLTHELRYAGIRAEYALGAQTTSKQLDIAKARNARLMVTIGSAEVQVKDLSTKSQHAVPLTRAVEEIVSRIRAS